MNTLTLHFITLMQRFKRDERGDLFSQSLILVLVTVVIAGALLTWQTKFFSDLGTEIWARIKALIS